MSATAAIAMVERDGSGRRIQLGNNAYPETAGRVLNERYSTREAIEGLMVLGDIAHLAERPDPADSYHVRDQDEWGDCEAIAFTGGTERFFAHYHHANLYLYCWTPDGWLAARGCQRPPPQIYYEQIRSTTPEEFRQWLSASTDAGWLLFMEKVAGDQRPEPMSSLIERMSADYHRRHRDIGGAS